MGKTIVSDDGRFEWDEEKDDLNIKAHGMHFAEITSVFDDPLFWERYDRENSSMEEDRYQGIGRIGTGTFFISYTERPPRTRIISAREVEPFEEDEYDEHIKHYFG
jgi:uncharacterized DUF497 family protein